MTLSPTVTRPIAIMKRDRLKAGIAVWEAEAKELAAAIVIAKLELAAVEDFLRQSSQQED